jgi:hypothetical protein
MMHIQRDKASSCAATVLTCQLTTAGVVIPSLDVLKMELSSLHRDRPGEHEMTTTEKVARRKPGLLEVAKELHNVSKACQITGYSRQQFYEIRRNFQQLFSICSATRNRCFRRNR